MGHTTTYGYDNLNRMVTSKDALSNTTTFVYDAADNRTVVVDPLGDRSTFAYDAGYCCTGEFALPAAPIKVIFALAAAVIASCTEREGEFIPKLMLIT